ncbi:hypothetical protein [Trinickia sp.]|uniref:hypothetical protein n=1 Tax=Trinickia sp. TaxID=2571163 RepID=UPI003F7DD0DF
MVQGSEAKIVAPRRGVAWAAASASVACAKANSPAAIATLGRRAHTDPFETIDALLVGRPVNSANRPFQTDRNLPFQFVF